MQSQIENYRAKAKEFARLMIVAKSLRPVEFHIRLEQKWATRIDQILIVAANATPPRDPNDNDDEEEDEDEEDEERDDEPPVVREPERDE
jgi:hypothetical protein